MSEARIVPGMAKPRGGYPHVKLAGGFGVRVGHQQPPARRHDRRGGESATERSASTSACRPGR